MFPMDTNIEHEKESVLVPDGEEVVLYKLADDGIGWDRLGRVRAYGSVTVGEGMNLIGMEKGNDGVNTTPIQSAERKSDSVVVHTANSTYSLDFVAREPQRARVDWSPMSIAKGIGKMVHDIVRF